MSTQIGTTVSYFGDVESSTGNSMQAGSLDFTVDNEVLEVFVDIGATSSPTVIPIIMPEQGSLPIEYKIKVIQTGGDTDFCNQLYTPEGSLLSLAKATSTSFDTWSLELSAGSTTPGNICLVDLVYFGWHDGDEGEGYSDEEKVSLNIHSVGTSTELQLDALVSVFETELIISTATATTTATTTDSVATTTSEIATSTQEVVEEEAEALPAEIPETSESEIDSVIEVVELDPIIETVERQSAPEPMEESSPTLESAPEPESTPEPDPVVDPAPATDPVPSS
ncbi:MAG: hypothetical protein Q7S72_01705 [Candidatus Taylorbacteria bacterium]|nr:hypothetical protein [Candidatus Taylorbacteria bacterium]